MIAASAGLIALLASGNEFFMADLLTITLNTGAVLRYTNADAPIAVGDNTFVPFDFERTGVKTGVGLEVDEMTIKFYVDGSQLISGIGFMQYITNGGFDGARIELDRAFMPTFGDTSLGTPWVFSGQEAEVISASRYECELKVASDLVLLDIQWPRDLYQTGCTNTLYSARCGVNRATYTTTSVAGTGSTTSVLNFTNAQPSGYFDLGTLIFTSGQNAGASRTVKAYMNGSPSTISFALPLPYPPQAGDAFILVPGCDKTYAGTNGCAKFANQSRYAGCPFVPVPETAR